MKDVWKKLMNLREHPERAGTPEYDLAELRAADEPTAWFLLLAEQPQLAPPTRWWDALRTRAGLPWARLLAAQPQFERFCRWETVGRGELVKLAMLAPKIFARQFPQGRPHDLYAFLTPCELMNILQEVPGAEDAFDMEEVNAKLTPDIWLNVLSFRPELERYFDWSLVEGQPSLGWDNLLRRQPRFADHCDFSQLKDWQLRRILRKQPQFADRCPKAEQIPPSAHGDQQKI